jgi:CO/xanthine dehydrogenase Mo-binding subunit
VPAIARWLNIDRGKVVLISEYTGGGFGSKVTAGISLIIPALLSKKANAPVMMRISREEETFIGRARPSLMGRMKIGFSREGRILALDMFVISTTAHTMRKATSLHRAVSFRSCTSRKRCAGEAPQS